MTRSFGAGVNMPATTSSSYWAAIRRTSVAHGPSRPSARGRNGIPKHAIVASGNTTTWAPAAAASAAPCRTSSRLLAGSGVVLSWQRATRNEPAIIHLAVAIVVIGHSDPAPPRVHRAGWTDRAGEEGHARGNRTPPPAPAGERGGRSGGPSGVRADRSGTAGGPRSHPAGHSACRSWDAGS